MEPISTTLAMATTAFNGVKLLVGKGAEIEQVANQLGKWYGLIADCKEREREIEKPLCLRGSCQGKASRLKP